MLIPLRALMVRIATARSINPFISPVVRTRSIAVPSRTGTNMEKIATPATPTYARAKVHFWSFILRQIRNRSCIVID
jgi:hypothetical protein